MRVVPPRLARYKCPTKVLVVDDLPKGLGGKARCARALAVSSGVRVDGRRRRRVVAHEEAGEQHA